jgi:pyruvate kinase
MVTDPETLTRAVSRLDRILDHAKSLELRYAEQLAQVHPDQRKSALNLIHYLALRHDDLQDLQADLGRLGLSQLGRAEAHVMASLLAVRHALCRLRGDQCQAVECVLGFEEGDALLSRNAARLLHRDDPDRDCDIMVTLPDEAAGAEEVVGAMLDAGCTCARINCAHAGPEAWTLMAEAVRAAAAARGREVPVFMDLTGPRLRTGEMAPGPSLLRLRPETDDRGRLVAPLRVVFHPVGDGAAPTGERVGDAGPALPVPADFFELLAPGLRVRVRDTTDALADLPVAESAAGVAIALCTQRVFLESGCPISLLDDANQVVAESALGDLPPREGFLFLRRGDTLYLHKDPEPGEPARFDESGNLTAPAHIACTLPEALDDLDVGQSVLFNEGKIHTEVRACEESGVWLEVTWTANPNGNRLRANKGINLPETHLALTGLTDTDLETLAFVARNADGVDVSFVNEPDDVEDLLDCLESVGGEDLGVILKIETRRGFKNLPGILLAAMEHPVVGVMIARGDLAVEAGWVHLPQIQEEILCLCEAAHMPAVWATQVLERLAKRGQPTRAEVTDAARAQRAECVMLNKGPHIVETIRTLASILESVRNYRAKKAPLMGRLELAEPDATEVGRATGTRVGRFDR